MKTPTFDYHFPDIFFDSTAPLPDLGLSTATASSRDGRNVDDSAGPSAASTSTPCVESVQGGVGVSEGKSFLEAGF